MNNKRIFLLLALFLTVFWTVVISGIWRFV